MRLYKVVAKKNGEVETKWVGSQSDAGKARVAFVDAGYKRAELETETVEVPTNKDGLLAFLNGEQQ